MIRAALLLSFLSACSPLAYEPSAGDMRDDRPQARTYGDTIPSGFFVADIAIFDDTGALVDVIDVSEIPIQNPNFELEGITFEAAP